MQRQFEFSWLAAESNIKTVYTVLHLFCGIGGGARGMTKSRGEYKGLVGRFHTLCGIDVDPGACRNFERITGAPAVQMDLFTREQYTAFHGHEPPPDWEEVTPDDLYNATGGICPDVIFLSPPCKSFSGLLPEKAANTPKYRALSQLVTRSMDLCMKAFEDDLPALILIENVPRITTRGAALLERVEAQLGKYGYVFNRATHDVGEVGGLGQHRKRFLLIARQEQKMPSFVYKPPVKRVRAIREILGELPMPDAPECGPMHKYPRLTFKTAVRLALIPEGGDHRDLHKVKPERYRLEYIPRGGGPYGVQRWDEPSGTVVGNASVRGSTAAAVADPVERFKNSYRVNSWAEACGTVTGQHSPSNGAICVADPRQPAIGRGGIFRLVEIGDEVAPVPLSWPLPEVMIASKEDRHLSHYRVSSMDEPAPTVTGATHVANGAPCMADIRVCDKGNPKSGFMRVMEWDKPSLTVVGSGDVHARSGAVIVADPRIDELPEVPKDDEKGYWVIISPDNKWHRALTTYELAMLQSFEPYFEDGTPFQLIGGSDKTWREWIGNAVPPLAAQAIGDVVLLALMVSSDAALEFRLGDIFSLPDDDVWVLPPGEEFEIAYSPNAA